MIFQSIDFLIFFLVVFVVYWTLGRRLQNVLLLGASYLFYGYVHPWMLTLLLGYTVVNYVSALGIRRFPERKAYFLAASVAASLGVLGVFKYFNFFVDNVNLMLVGIGLTSFGNNLNIFLPVGISFYTFQTLGYTIDVYMGRIEPRKNFIDFALFVSFFPQLVAGPIERAQRLLQQFERKRFLSPSRARDGLTLIMWGFFKKLVISDNVAVIVERVFRSDDPGFFVLWAGVFAFSIQIFADFSAYTDIARGAARLLGIDLVKNFDHPYISKSPTEFWRRWHISLSNWFRDYVYIPLGGSRSGPWLNAATLMITFLLTGLWHGASWNFVLWGLYHGALIQGHRILKGIVPESVRASSALGIPFVIFMFALTNVGWLIFKETDFNYMVKYLTLSPGAASLDNARIAAFLFATVFIYSIPLWLHAAFDYIRENYQVIRAMPAFYNSAFRTAASSAMFIAILLLYNGSTVDFIYFQF